METITPQQLYARVYDLYVEDWEGEVDFYRELIGASPLRAAGVLEIACGTGRITLRLAGMEVDITGLDRSAEMLAVARGKSAGMENVRFVEGDMRSFGLGRQFGWAIIPGHSFQVLNTPADQLACLAQISKHLVPGGGLVVHLDHQDVAWLGGLIGRQEPDYRYRPPVSDPTSGARYRQRYGWKYEPATQTATVFIRWEQLGSQEAVLQSWNLEPMPMHCLFRFEMEHLLGRAGFEVQALYGDFFKRSLADGSPHMIWVAHKPG